MDIIFLCCSNPTALNQTIKYAYDKGVPVVSYDGFVTAPEATSAMANYIDGGYQLAKSVIEKIGGKGNILMVSGIAGVNTSDSFDKGALKAFAEYPNIKLIGTVQGKWTDQIAQVEVQKFLATHPERLDGIVLQSPAEIGVLTGAAAIGAANGADEFPRRIRCCVLLAPTPGMGRKRILHLAARRRNLLRLECGLANTGGTRAENTINCPTSHEILPRRRQSPAAGKL